MHIPFYILFSLLCLLWFVYARKKYRMGCLQIGTGIFDFGLLYILMVFFILQK